MEKIKTTTWITLVVTVVYVVVLILAGDKLPVEKTVSIYGLYDFDLSFSVSTWWYLVLGPAVIFLVGYIYSMELIIGKNPPRKENIERKYHTRYMFFFINGFSLGFALALAVLSALIWLLVGIFNPTEVFGLGPISTVLNCFIAYLVCYIVLGFWEEVAFTLVWNTFLDEKDESLDEEFNPKLNLINRFRTTLAEYSKGGIFKLSPFIIGMTIGFIIKFIYVGIFKRKLATK